MYTIKDEQGVNVITIKGKVDVDMAQELDDAIEAIYNAENKAVIIDLANVDYLSSSGLRTFVSATKRAKEAKGRLVLCNISPTVHETFKVVQLEQLFESYPTLADATNALH